MNSRDLRGGPREPWLQVKRFWQLKRGPVLRKTFKLNHRKRLNTSCAFLLMLAGTYQTRDVGL